MVPWSVPSRAPFTQRGGRSREPPDSRPCRPSGGVYTAINSGNVPVNNITLNTITVSNVLPFEGCTPEYTKSGVNVQIYNLDDVKKTYQTNVYVNRTTGALAQMDTSYSNYVRVYNSTDTYSDPGQEQKYTDMDTFHTNLKNVLIGKTLISTNSALTPGTISMSVLLARNSYKSVQRFAIRVSYDSSGRITDTSSDHTYILAQCKPKYDFSYNEYDLYLFCDEDNVDSRRKNFLDDQGFTYYFALSYLSTGK